MRAILTTLFCSALLLACGSTPKPVQVYNRECSATPVQASDLAQFNITPTPGKVMVVRIVRSVCPTCKEDLQQVGMLFSTKKWSSENIQLVLVAYKKEGIETKQTFDTYVRAELAKVGFPIEAAQIVFLDKTYPQLLQTKSKSGELMFPEWKAVPYSLVFGKDGRLAYRGQFTVIASQQDLHYDFITKLQSETCAPGLP